MKTDAEKEQVAKDYYASVRTNLLLAWVLSNVSFFFFDWPSLSFAFFSDLGDVSRGYCC
jgi:hypothetical protein